MCLVHTPYTMTNGSVNLPRLLNLEETAAYFGVSEHTMRNYLKSGRVRGFKVGLRWYVNAETLASQLSDLAAGPVEQAS